MTSDVYTIRIAHINVLTGARIAIIHRERASISPSRRHAFLLLDPEETARMFLRMAPEEIAELDQTGYTEVMPRWSWDARDWTS
jgi:hypothetical protein